MSKTGRAYAGRLTGLLDDLADSTRAARSGNAGTLRILSTPGFAARWLVPRMQRFSNPGAIRLRVADGAPSTDFSSNDADVVIQWRDDPVPGVTVWPFLHTARYPVAAPGFAAREGIEHPRDLLQTTLFKDETDDMWSDWFRGAGVVGRVPDAGPSYPNCEYATTAAEAGIGVALAYDAVVRETVAEGRLVRLFDTMTTPFTIYAITCKSGREDEPLIRDFREWLLTEAGADGSLPESNVSGRAEASGA